MADFAAKEIVKVFESPAGPLRILDEVSVEMDRGQNLAIVGPSGSGKSTFLHIAGTLESPTSGSIFIEGRNPAGLSEQQLAQFRNQQVGFVFQEHYLLPQLSALENVLIPIVAAGGTSEQTIERATHLLEQVGLTERLHHKPATLSGGERQRVAVARALICEPVVLLADEPTGSLDHKNAEAIGMLLLDLQNESNTILICVTHSERLASMFGKQVELNEGKFGMVESLR